MLHKVAFAAAPIDEEVFGEEGGDDHAAAVVHIGRVVELAHGGVDDGEAGVAAAPGVEVLVGVFPVDVHVFGFERLVHAIGEEVVGN